MTSPLVIDVAHIRHSSAFSEHIHQEGPCPERVGLDMIAIPQGGEIIVDVVLTPLNGAVMVSGTVSGRLEGQCSRTLKPISADHTFSVEAVFAENASFLDSDDVDDAADSDADSFYPLSHERIDLLPALIDEAGLTLPFNPVGEDYGMAYDDVDVPAPDGVSGEADEREDDAPVDPRWAGLEKFT